MAIDGATGVLLTLIDVTEREQAKMTITAAEKSLRLFSEAVVDHALITTNIHGVITDCNNGATMLTGFARQDLVGKSYSLLYAPEELVKGIPHTELRAAASQGSAKQQRWLQRHGGDRFFADGTITAHNLPDELPSFTIAFRDTTDAVRRAEELERVSATREVAIDALATENADLQQFALVAAHDMQEPLRVVSGYLDILRTRYGGALDDKATQYIDFAINGAQRMGRLIRSLLDIARIDHGEIHAAEVSADEAFDEAMKNLSRLITETKASVQRSTLGLVYADKDMLVRLFQNLVGNALKFVAKGVPPKVLVDVRDQAGARAILVKDHGIGVSPEDQARIFEAFERIHGRGEYMGSGLGLAICKGIVQRHGGELSIESTLGQGATFIFTLPAAKG